MAFFIQHKFYATFKAADPNAADPIDKSRKCDLDDLCSRVRQLERKLDAKLEELEKLVTDVKSSCITNFRLYQPQQTALWRSYGFLDSSTAVITGVTNFNADDHADFVHRRFPQMLINGTWSYLTS